jgi:uncharacterized protein
MKISKLFFYPIKSCKGISTLRMELTETGPRLDRLFTLTDSEGRFLSQREFPSMAQIETQMTGFPNLPAVAVRYLDYPVFFVPVQTDEELLRIPSSQYREIQIHGDPCFGIDMGDECAKWFSSVLGFDTRLIRQAGHLPRIRYASMVGRDISVSYADGYPLLVLSEASLGNLNHRLSSESLPLVGQDRFRANLILSDCDPHAEDSLGTVQLGSAVIRSVKKCARCIIVDTDQQKGARDLNSKVLKTLAEYRRTDRAVFFGMNCLIIKPGLVAVGDEVTPICSSIML